jgi:5-methylcytosine-specific restriction endonuclease McrA
MSQAYVSAELRQLVRQRAAGLCEYCLIPEASSFFLHEIDHITAQQHGGETIEGNLALACIICNKHKGTNLSSIDPETGKISSLFHPRRDR